MYEFEKLKKIVEVMDQTNELSPVCKWQLDTLQTDINLELSILEYDLKMNHRINRMVKTNHVIMKKDPEEVIKQAKEYILEYGNTHEG